MSPDPVPRPPRRRLVRVAALVLGLAAALVLAEVATRVALARSGKPFDSTAAAELVGTLHSSLVDAAPRVRRIDEAAAQDVHSQGQRLHPYYGYDFQGYLNNLPTELAYHRSPEAEKSYDVVILGGSVAMSFLPDGVEALTAALRADPELATRPIMVLGHGRAAHKAPQQTLVLQYLLCAGAKPDAVIALDGFNEVAVGFQNERQGVAGSYPCGNIWLNLAGAVASDPPSLAAAMELRTRQLAVIDAAEDYARWDLSRFAVTSWLGLRRIESLRTGASAAALELERRVASSQAFTALSGPPNSGTDEQRIARLVRAWREDGLALHALCSARGIDFLDVLQPTALLPGTKKLTAREQKGNVANESWQTGVGLGYPLLESAGAELAAAGVPYLDATRVFADVEEALYFDTCHFNARGYAVIATEIGRALVAARARARSADK
ncbi:MAG: hypothetical protein IT453_11575 [Planctomycetes bacterium]|nr:hypothetical protein [Planctomycetota bacterium]